MCVCDFLCALCRICPCALHLCLEKESSQNDRSIRLQHTLGTTHWLACVTMHNGRKMTFEFSQWSDLWEFVNTEQYEVYGMLRCVWVTLWKITGIKKIFNMDYIGFSGRIFCYGMRNWISSGKYACAWVRSYVSVWVCVCVYVKFHVINNIRMLKKWTSSKSARFRIELNKWWKKTTPRKGI